MSVQIEDEWRYKKVRSEHASRSAFAYKINKRLQKKFSSKMSYGYSVVTPYSREVIFKITGGARSQKGIKGSIHYISKNGQIELTDSNGVKYKTKEEISDAVDLVQSHVVRRIKFNRKAEKLTHNLVFSVPIVAGVSKKDMLQTTIKTLKEKYPHNLRVNVRFINYATIIYFIFIYTSSINFFIMYGRLHNRLCLVYSYCQILMEWIYLINRNKKERSYGS